MTTGVWRFVRMDKIKKKLMVLIKRREAIAICHIVWLIESRGTEELVVCKSN